MHGKNEDISDRTIGMAESPDAGHFLSRGEAVDGAYKVLEFIGAGAFGEVYLVHHDILQRNFALKLLRSSGIDDAVRSRFVQEVQVMAKLEHPNIVKIYNSGLYKGQVPYYVMDLITGKSLADLISERGRIDALEALTIFVAVADALKFSHSRKIVHRDIKPANIIVADGDGTLESRVRVVDFGVAKLLGRNSPAYQALTKVGQVFGSPLYMSPEQCSAADIDNRSDIYSLGCALFETLTGSVPFKGATVMDTFQMHFSQPPPALKQKAPGQDFAPELEEVMQQLLAKRPEERFQNMEQVKNSLMLLADRLDKKQADIAGSGVMRRRRIAIGVLGAAVVAGLLTGMSVVLNKALEHKESDKPIAPAVTAQASSDDTRDKLDSITRDLKQPDASSDQPTSAQSVDWTLPVKSNQYFKGLDAAGNSLYVLPGGTDNFIGKFSVLSQQRLLDAPFSGQVTLRRGDKWLFKPDPVVGANPSLLLGFRAEDIAGIDLGALPAKDCARVLKLARERFAELCCVVVRDHPVDGEILAQINRVPLLRMLAINAQGLTTAQVLGLKRLSRMEEFEIANYQGDLSTLLDRLCFDQLHVLVLQNVKLKEFDLFNLNRASNLERLALDHVGMKREWLKNLLGLNHLAYLDLVNDGENINWVEPLRPFKGLKELVIRDDQSSNEERKNLHDVLKQVLKIKGRTDNCNVRTSRNSEIGGFGDHGKEASDIGTMLKP